MNKGDLMFNQSSLKRKKNSKKKIEIKAIDTTLLLFLFMEKK